MSANLEHVGPADRRVRGSRRSFVGAAALAAAGPAVLAACGAPGAGDGGGPAVTWSGVQEIEFWGTAYPPVVEAYSRLIQQFHQENPRVRITGGQVVAKVGDSNTLIPAVSGGTPPHAAEVNQPNTWAFAGKDVYAPLNDYIKRDRATSQAMADFYPGQIEAVTWRGQTYFFPAGVSMEVWHANKTFWQRAGVDVPRDGWTWTDLATTFGPKLQSAVGPDGSALMLELNEMYRMLAFVKQNGGDMLDKSGTKLTIAEPPSVEAFEFVRGLVARGIVVEQNKEKKNFRLDDLRVALELEGMTRIPVYRKAVGAEQAWVPGPKKKVRANIYDSWVVGLVRNAEPRQDGGGLPVAVLADPAGAEPGLPEGAGQSPAAQGGGAAAERGRPVGHRAPDPRGDGRPELRHHLPLHARHRPHPGQPSTRRCCRRSCETASQSRRP